MLLNWFKRISKNTLTNRNNKPIIHISKIGTNFLKSIRIVKRKAVKSTLCFFQERVGLRKWKVAMDFCNMVMRILFTLKEIQKKKKFLIK